MTKEEAFKELEEYIITSISTEENKHININVAKRVIDTACEEQQLIINQLMKDRDYWKKSFNKQAMVARNA